MRRTCGNTFFFCSHFVSCSASARHISRACACVIFVPSSSLFTSASFFSFSFVSGYVRTASVMLLSNFFVSTALSPFCNSITRCLTSCQHLVHHFFRFLSRVNIEHPGGCRSDPPASPLFSSRHSLPLLQFVKVNIGANNKKKGDTPPFGSTGVLPIPCMTSC